MGSSPVGSTKKKLSQMRQLFSAFEELYEAIRHADSGIKQSAMPTSPCAALRLGTVAASAVYGQSSKSMMQSAMPTSPCAASRLGTVAASAVCGQSETMTLESKLSASCSHLVRAWRLAYAQRKESISALSLLRKMGLEPTRCTHHKILSLARLPVPTLPRIPDLVIKDAGDGT